MTKPTFSSFAAARNVGLALAAFLGAHSLLAAAAPANDNCAGAVAIPANVSPNTPFFGPVVSIAEATSTGETSLTNSCQPALSRGLWYRFTPMNAGTYEISTCTGATTVDDTVLAIYRSAGGCGGPFVQVACSDDVCGPGEGLLAAITAPLLADTTYYIVAWQYNTTPPPAGKTNIQVVVTWQTPPENDTCLFATEVLLNTRQPGSTILASNNYQLSGGACFQGVRQTPAAAVGRDVVYWFEAPADDNYSFKVYNYSDVTGYNLMLYVGGFCQPGATPQTVNCIAASNRNSAGTAEEVMCLGLTNGQQVYIYVDDTSVNAGSTFILEVTRCIREAEPNNTPATASRPACGIEGSISPMNDRDFYALGSFPAGWRAFVMVDGESAELANFDLRINSLTDTLEYDDQDNDMQFGNTSPNVAGVPLVGGPAFVQVNYPGRDEEPYRLYATVQPPIAFAAVEVEPNDTVANATFDPRGYYAGSLSNLSPSADIDIYRFEANEGDIVFVSLDCAPARTAANVNAQLALLDQFGNELVIVEGNAGTPDPGRTTNNLFNAVQPNLPSEALIYRCADGIYHVRVSPTVVGPSGAGNYLLSITRNCIAGSTGVNTPPAVTNVSVTPGVVEGGSVTLNGTISEPDLGNAISLLVNWGDGKSNLLNFADPGVVPFSLNHQYVDDDPTGTTSDTYVIDVTVVDNAGAGTKANASVTTSNASPRFGTIAVAPPASVGSGAVLSGTIIDPGTLDSFTLSVNWGDGSPVQNFNYAAGTTEFSQLHNYATTIANYNVSVTLRDDDNGMSSTNLPLQVTSNALRSRLLSIKKLANGHFMLQLQGVPSVTYRIDASTNLPPAWSSLGTVPSGPQGTFSFEDASPPPRQRFYRAVGP